MDYSTKLKSPKWQRKRLEIFQRDNFTCTSCGESDETLHVHHEKYVGANPWDTPSEFLKTVCHQCHGLIEQIKNSFEPGITILKIDAVHFRDDKNRWARVCTLSNGDKVLTFFLDDKYWWGPRFINESFVRFHKFLSELK